MIWWCEATFGDKQHGTEKAPLDGKSYSLGFLGLSGTSNATTLGKILTFDSQFPVGQ